MSNHARRARRRQPRGRRILSFILPATLALLFVPGPVAAQPTGYQEYYVLGHEEHVWRAFLAINDDPDPSDIQAGRICSTVSLVATADHQIVIYDHWEDGYEADIFHPLQSSTEVYGDGDPSNGGVGEDMLLAGDDVNLTSDQDNETRSGYVPVDPRNPAQIRYDGGDRVVTSGGPVDLTHAMWPLNNTWIGGAWEIYSRQAYGQSFSYRLPIGEDLYTLGGGDDGTYGDFRNVFLQLGAFEDNTTLTIDNGTDQITLTLDRGQMYSSMGYVNSATAPPILIRAGTTVHSNKPLQAGLITGADGNFQGRFLVLLPDQLWGADYVVPVPSGGPGDEAEVYLFNPNETPITIHTYDQETQTTFVLTTTTPYSQERGGLGAVPQHSAARFTSSDGVFGVVVCADTSDTTYDWGFSGIPSKYLTRDYYIPWAPGDDNLPPENNGSPVWVAPLADDTTFYVDFSPLDSTVDQTFTLDVLEQQRIFDPDNDNTGMHIWATDRFAVAWGEDPGTAGTSDPYLDLGLSTLPLQQGWLDPVLTLDKSAQPTTLPPAGGTVTFTLVAQAHQAPLADVWLTDTLPLRWSYVPASSEATLPNGSSTNPEPIIEDRTLSWNLWPDLDINQSLTLTFQARITDTSGLVQSTNVAEVAGRHQYSDALFNPSAEVTVDISPLNLTKSVSQLQAAIGDSLVYTLSYANTSDTLTATNVLIRDVLPRESLVFQSASAGGSYDARSSTVAWSLDQLAPHATGAVTFTARVNSFVEPGTVVENVAAIESDQAERASSNRVQTSVLAPDLSFSKSAPTLAAAGEVITYLLRYENTGSGPATGVRIQDTIPVSTTYVSGSLALDTGSGWVPLTDAGDGDPGAYLSPTLVITPGQTPGSVASGEAGQVRFQVRLDAGLQSGSPVLNAATLDRDLDTPRSSNLAVTRIFSLLIEKTSQQAVASPGGTISYTLRYQNSSQTITQTAVTVREAIPDYTRLLSGTVYGGDALEYSWDSGASWSSTVPVTPATHLRWRDDVLPPGNQASVGFAVQVNETLLPGTVIHNMAHISSTQTMTYGGWLPSNPVEVPTVDLWIEKEAQPQAVEGGERFSYTISYGNRGSADAAGVQVADLLPSSTTYEADSIWGNGASDAGEPLLVWEIVSVTAGSSAQQLGYAVILDTGLAPGTEVTNTARLTSSQQLLVSEPATVTVAVPDQADLRLTHSAAPEPVRVGGTLTYTLVYSNSGPSPAQGVAISDTLPLSTSFGGLVTAAPPLGEPAQNGHLLTWQTPTLTAGVSGTIVFTVTVHPGAGGLLVNRASIASATPDPAPENNEHTLTTTVAFATVYGTVFDDADASGAQESGESGIAAVRVTLDGEITATTDLSGSYVLTTTLGGVHTVTERDPDGYFSTTPHTITLDLRPGSDYQVDFGDATPGLVIGKTALDLNGPPLYPGDHVEYRVLVTNTHSAGSQTGVVVQDPLPAGLALRSRSVSCSSGATCAVSGDVISATTGHLDPGQVLALSFQATVDSAASTVEANLATVHSDNQRTQQSDPVFLPGGGAVKDGLVIDKTATDVDGLPLYPGDEIAYQVAVTNTNLMHSQSNVTIGDVAPENTLLLAGSTRCSPGATCSEWGSMTGDGLRGWETRDFGGMAVATTDSLAPGEILTLTFSVQVKDGLFFSIGGNVAAVESDQQNAQTTSPVYPPGGLAVECLGKLYLPLLVRGP